MEIGNLAMTDTQLYFSVGLPILAVLTRLTISLMQVSGNRNEMRGFRGDLRDIREDLREMRNDIKLLTGKVIDVDNRLFEPKNGWISDKFTPAGARRAWRSRSG